MRSNASWPLMTRFPSASTDTYVECHDHLEEATQHTPRQTHGAPGARRVLPGQLRPDVRVHERPRVHQIDRRDELEDLRSLQEEGPQLGKEQGEALVDLDLRQVRLDLREVGVAGEIRRQVRRDAVLDVHAAFRVGAAVDEVASLAVHGAVLDGGERRQDLQVAAGGQVGHPLEHAHLRHEALDVARHRRPDHALLILALDLAHDLETPAVLDAGGALRIPEALERDRHLGRVAVLDDLRAAVEQRLPRPIGEGNRAPLRLVGADDAVALHVVGVEVKVVADLLIHERVQVDRHQVVLPRRVTVHPARPHQTRIGVVQVEGEVDVLAVVGDVELGVFGRRSAVERRLLHELREHRRRAPHLVVEAAVDLRRRVGPGDPDPRPAGERAVAAARLGDGAVVHARPIRPVAAHPQSPVRLRAEIRRRGGQETQSERKSRAGSCHGLTP